MMNVFFFDIDGCILPCIMPVLPNEEKEQIIMVNNIKEKMKGISLYPNFIDFFNRYCKTKNSLVYFITGRKKSQFYDITNEQLFSLSNKKHNVFYFPEDGIYTVEYYKWWKIEMMSGLFNQTVGCKHNHKYTYFLFDDNTFYFKDLKRMIRYPIFTYEMNKDEDWNKDYYDNLFIYFYNNVEKNCNNCKRPFEERIIVCNRCSKGIHVKDYWKGK